MPNKGFKHSKETKEKIKEWSEKNGFKKGNQFWKLKKSHKGPTQPKSDEWRKKVGKIRKERIKEGKIIPAFLGKKRPEHSKKMKGENNSNWQGGKSFEPYSIDWTETLKKSIRERDKYICQVCNDYGNIVHHIDYNKKNNNPDNLITLCESCHGKTGFNRKHWIMYFGGKLK